MGTIELFGFTIHPIHIIAANFLIFVVGGTVIGFLYRNLKQRWESRGGRQLDHYLDTVTLVSEPDADGYRTLSIRNKGMTERVENVVRGNNERTWLIAAAHSCDWERRFIKDADPDKQARILHVVRNAMTRHFVAGENAYEVGLPTKEIDYYFAPTGADAAVGGVRMIRVLWVTGETLKIIDEHPVEKWTYEIDKVTGKVQDHSVRLKSMRQMAQALFYDDGCRNLNGDPVRIIGWMRGRVPV